MAIARRREERIRSRALARGGAADTAGGGGSDAPSVVLLRRRCRELEAKCASVSSQLHPHCLLVTLHARTTGSWWSTVYTWPGVGN
jgi:hypothetical protein